MHAPESRQMATVELSKEIISDIWVFEMQIKHIDGL